MSTTKPSESVAQRCARALENCRLGDAPFDHEVAALLRNMDDALRAAASFVETFTANGCQERPPGWADDFDAETIAERCRKVLRNGRA